MIFTFSSKFGTDEAPDDHTVSPANPDSACPAGAMTAGLSASETDKCDRAQGCNCSLAGSLLLHSPARTR